MNYHYHHGGRQCGKKWWVNSILEGGELHLDCKKSLQGDVKKSLKKAFYDKKESNVLYPKMKMDEESIKAIKAMFESHRITYPDIMVVPFPYNELRAIRQNNRISLVPNRDD